ncbi:MAG TPA: DUF4893 domain-containing protein [Sphingomonas sp.]|jgi:predicted small lipoprotein YifL|nr:DUF4893 domain-containing protein [Sphingomonas sp.]
MRRAVIVAVLALGACGQKAPLASAASGPPDWRQVATPADRARLREWRTAFVTGLDQARASGHAAEVAREGKLLEPDAGMAGGMPPAGDYRCRVIKLGSKGQSGPGYVAYPEFGCRIDDEGGIRSFRKLTGSQRPVGVIMNDGGRQVFLGTMMLSDESRALFYGRDPDRDMIGAVERLGDGRWRMILPYPHYESVMDVMELVPAAAAPRS